MWRRKAQLEALTAGVEGASIMNKNLAGTMTKKKRQTLVLVGAAVLVVAALTGCASNRRAYNVEAWPTIIILDKQGRIRYTHIGEGAYDVQEDVIKTLVAEK